MPSNFTGTNPQVDVVPDLGTTLSNPQHREAVHQPLRDQAAATQQWIRTHILPVFANGWVTTARLATAAVTDPKIASVAASKVTGTIANAVATALNVRASYVAMGPDGAFPPLRCQRLGGRLNSVGDWTGAHNIGGSSVPSKIAGCWIIYRGDSLEAVVLTQPDSVKVDGGNVIIQSPTAYANRYFHAYLFFTEDTASWAE